MQIQLTNRCHVSAEKLSHVNDGYWCADCKKTVIDYSNMSDGEVLTHITMHGLGCGQFRDDQLDREMQPVRRKKKTSLFIYLPLLIAFLFKTPKAIAQCREKTDSAQYQNHIMNSRGAIPAVVIESSQRHEDKAVTRSFGGAASIVTRQYKRYSLFWGLIKFKIKQRK